MCFTSDSRAIKRKESDRASNGSKRKKKTHQFLHFLADAGRYLESLHLWTNYGKMQLE